ncbi:hypothetical protein QQF64_031016 [Cirrhinus molitorella]|uniref:Uncharacterized protein n=1 Tax=Cirrhinus molitorella TaxID=172907 RepID=A0ABR3N4Z4_9TELE
MAGIKACVVSGGILTLVTAPGVKGQEGIRGEMGGIEACVIGGGILTLVTAPRAEEREEMEGVKLGSSAEACSR